MLPELRLKIAQLAHLWEVQELTKNAMRFYGSSICRVCSKVMNSRNGIATRKPLMIPRCSSRQFRSKIAHVEAYWQSLVAHKVVTRVSTRSYHATKSDGAQVQLDGQSAHHHYYPYARYTNEQGVGRIEPILPFYGLDGDHSQSGWATHAQQGLLEGGQEVPETAVDDSHKGRRTY